MCITEYNEAETLQAIGNESFAEGKIEGKAEDIEQINQMVSDGLIPEDIAQSIISKLSGNN